MAEIIARKYSGRGVEYNDLYQVASYALVLAVTRFDPGKSVQFASYATPTIVGEIKKYFRDTMWSLKVPRRLKDISVKILNINVF
jgi:RNA polymerase sigma-B factor